MTRRILCISDVPEPAGSAGRLCNAMLLMMAMHARGFNVGGFTGLENPRWHMDYAIEAPDLLPAGGCYQDEIECDDGDEKNIPEQTLIAAQITVEREGE